MIILSKLGLRIVMQESYHRMIADRDTNLCFQFRFFVFTLHFMAQACKKKVKWESSEIGVRLNKSKLFTVYM